jgi:hypothetical protein
MIDSFVCLLGYSYSYSYSGMVWYGMVWYIRMVGIAVADLFLDLASGSPYVLAAADRLRSADVRNTRMCKNDDDQRIDLSS